MRICFSALAGVLCLGALSSCSFKGDLTKADLANLRLRDFARFGQPHLVKVTPQEVAAMDRAERMSGRTASLSPRHRPGMASNLPVPSGYVPPTLPEGAIAFDGSILPPKEGGRRAVLDVGGSLPGGLLPRRDYAENQASPPRFSIE